jgi:hypothetical protein
MQRSKLFYAPIILCVMFTQACWYSDSLTNRFAQANYEAAQAQVEAQTVLLTLQEMETRQDARVRYAEIALRIGKITAVHRKLALKLKDCIDGNGNLQFNTADQRELNSLLNILVGTVADVVGDSDIFPKLNATTRATISTVLAAIPLAVDQMRDIVARFKPKNNAPSLRVQLSQQVMARVDKTSSQLDRADSIMAEVKE